MKLYREYGDNQESLFDTWTKSDTFGNLSYSKHLALLALPFAQRQEFAEQNNVEEMSTRELAQAIKEELQAAEKRASNLENQLKGAQMLADSRLEAVQEAQSEVARLNELVAKTREQRDKEVASVDKLKAKVTKAQNAQKAAEEQLQKAIDDPQIPESVMERMRQQVAAEAAKKATEDLQKQLDAATAKAEELTKVISSTEEQLAVAQKAAKLANPEAVAFKVKFERIQQDFLALKKDLSQIRQNSPELGTGLTSAVRTMLQNWLAEVER